MYDTPKDILDALRATPTVLEALLRDCTQEQAQRARGGDEGWSVVEVICHLRDAEERALERMRVMRDQVDPFLPGYNQERWAQERNYAAVQLHEAVAAFVRFRSQHMAELAALASDDWDRTGQHAELGRITIASHAFHIVSHDLVHAAQIARQLSGQ